eukprot:35549-Heterocapsa_arctica.AAC.1
MRLRRRATTSRPSSESRPQCLTCNPSKVSAVLMGNLRAAFRIMAGVMALSSPMSRSEGSRPVLWQGWPPGGPGCQIACSLAFSVARRSEVWPDHLESW